MAAGSLMLPGLSASAIAHNPLAMEAARMLGMSEEQRRQLEGEFAQESRAAAAPAADNRGHAMEDDNKEEARAAAAPAAASSSSSSSAIPAVKREREELPAPSVSVALQEIEAEQRVLQGRLRRYNDAVMLDGGAAISREEMEEMNMLNERRRRNDAMRRALEIAEQADGDAPQRVRRNDEAEERRADAPDSEEDEPEDGYEAHARASGYYDAVPGAAPMVHALQFDMKRVAAVSDVADKDKAKFRAQVELVEAAMASVNLIGSGKGDKGASIYLPSDVAAYAHEEHRNIKLPQSVSDRGLLKEQNSMQLHANDVNATLTRLRAELKTLYEQIYNASRQQYRVRQYNKKVQADKKAKVDMERERVDQHVQEMAFRASRNPRLAEKLYRQILMKEEMKLNRIPTDTEVVGSMRVDD